MNSEFYDVLKMQKEDAEKLVADEKRRISSAQQFNSEARSALDESSRKIQENIEFLKSIGVVLNDELEDAKKEAHCESEFVIQEINKAQILNKEYNISYADLVEKAHDQGFVNTSLKELLTEEEIKDAETEYKKIVSMFSEKTKLRKIDIVFLVTAVALQVVRQYVLDPMLKEQRAKASNNDESAKGNKGPGWYRVPTEEILVNKVPFDAVKYSDYESVKGFLKGHQNHRYVTLGHDPFLGWIFGTANIMTGTITNFTFNSAHVKYVPGTGPVIHSQANTVKVFETVLDRVSNEGVDGIEALVFALIREGIHLKSDIGTNLSLPIPGISVLCPELGKKLCSYGIDMGSVGAEASLSILINTIISVVHRMIKPDEDDEKIYEVRTRKILLISNVIASVSNVIAVGVAAGMGVASENPETIKKAVKYLDVGGLLVTIARLFSDIRFISKVKEEFINSKLDEMLLEELAKLEKY